MTAEAKSFRVMFQAEQVDTVQVLTPESEVPIWPGDTWGVRVNMKLSGMCFSLHRNDAEALANALRLAIADLDADAKKHASGGKG